MRIKSRRGPVSVAYLHQLFAKWDLKGTSKNNWDWMGKWPNALISLLQRIHAILPGGRELHTKVAHKKQ